MELLYIWLGESKNKSCVFEKQGFKFTGEYDIYFDEKESKLEIAHIEEYDTDFYKLENGLKSNVKLTCIVGKNGAGKSCLLEIIQSILNNNIDTPFNFQLDNYNTYLIMFKDIDKKIQVDKPRKDLNILAYNKIKDDIFFILKKGDINNYIYKNSILYKAKYVGSYRSSDRLLDYLGEKISIINYNNSIIDYKYEAINRMNYYDISSSFLLQHYHLNDNENGLNTGLNKINTYSLYEFLNKINFIFSKLDLLDKYFANNKLKRDYLFIDSRSNYNFDSLKVIYKTTKPITPFISDIKKKIKQKLIDFRLDIYERCLWKITCEFLFLFFSVARQFIFEVGKELNVIKYENIDKTKLNYSKPEELIKSVILNVINSIDESKCLIQEVSELKELLKNISDLFDCLRFFINYTNKSDYSRIYISLKETILEKKLQKLIRLYYNTKKYVYRGDYLNFIFYPRYSSGENALITVFARIYDLVINKISKGFKTTFNKTNTLIVFFDEAEISFHPEWSKEYLYSVLSYVQNLFKPFENIKNIHFIVTTNDPIILSDVLPNDIIYLEGREVKIKNISAFGSNILDLYSDNFFISDGLIGKYAQEKIQKVLTCIKDKKTDEECEFIIQNIGDENIKNYLNVLYNQVKGNNHQ